MQEAAPPRQRLAWLDVVRGIAAAVVFVQHVLERDSPAFQGFADDGVNLGRVGVTAFFLVSGFVIPYSLERAGSLKQFWMGRFLRLFPMYWIALAGVLVCVWAGRSFSEQGFDGESVTHVLVNLTMLQQLVGIPNGLPVAWTLGIEMVFYWLISAAFIVKANERSVLLLLGVAAAALCAGAALPLALDRPVPGIGAMFLIVTACFGTVFYRLTVGKVSAGAFAACAVLVVVVQLALCGVDARYAIPSPVLGGELIGPESRIWSSLVGYALFFGLFAVRSLPFPRALTYLGLVSYSVYLLHPFVWYFGPTFDQPALTIAVGLAITVALSSLTYHLVEQPAQRFAKRLRSGEVALRRSRVAA